MKKEETIEKLKQKVKEIQDEAKQKENDLKECKKEIKQADDKDKKIDELTDCLQRLQAEFENYKKYIERQTAELRKYAHADIILKLLPVLDSFELALKNTSNKEEFVKGVELIYSQLFSTLEKEGLRHIKAEGQKLDPLKHEVLLKEKSDKEEDTILEELQKGYMLCDKVIRHSKVKVCKK